MQSPNHASLTAEPEFSAVCEVTGGWRTTRGPLVSLDFESWAWCRVPHLCHLSLGSLLVSNPS